MLSETWYFTKRLNEIPSLFLHIHIHIHIFKTFLRAQNSDTIISISIFDNGDLICFFNVLVITMILFVCVVYNVRTTVLNKTQ